MSVGDSALCGQMQDAEPPRQSVERGLVKGTLEPLSSGASKKKNPGLFQARHQRGVSAGSVTILQTGMEGKKHPLPFELLSSKNDAERSYRPGMHERADIVWPQLWSINPFITNHLVSDESV